MATQEVLMPGIKVTPKVIWKILRMTWTEWGDDNGASLSAALAYYTVFSLAPIMVIVVAMVGLIFGADAARGRIVEQIGGLVGEQGGELVESMIVNASQPAKGALATILGVITLLFGATGAFSEMQASLNHIWDLPKKKAGGILSWVTDRFISFSLVLGTGFLLLVSLILGAAFAAVTEVFGSAGVNMEVYGQLINFAISFALTTLLFALIFRVLPDVEIAWNDVWVGALATSFAFSVGKLLIGLYLGNTSTGSSYGAAGSLVIVMVWVYYSAQILLLGAEFTQVYSRMIGSRRNERALVTAGQYRANRNARAGVEEGAMEATPVPAEVSTAAGRGKRTAK